MATIANFAALYALLTGLDFSEPVKSGSTERFTHPTGRVTVERSQNPWGWRVFVDRLAVDGDPWEVRLDGSATPVSAVAGAVLAALA
jgi:hypothetical protein